MTSRGTAIILNGLHTHDNYHPNEHTIASTADEFDAAIERLIPRWLGSLIEPTKHACTLTSVMLTLTVVPMLTWRLLTDDAYWDDRAVIIADLCVLLTIFAQTQFLNARARTARHFRASILPPYAALLTFSTTTVIGIYRDQGGRLVDCVCRRPFIFWMPIGFTTIALLLLGAIFANMCSSDDRSGSDDSETDTDDTDTSKLLGGSNLVERLFLDDAGKALLYYGALGALISFVLHLALIFILDQSDTLCVFLSTVVLGATLCAFFCVWLARTPVYEELLDVAAQVTPSGHNHVIDGTGSPYEQRILGALACNFVAFATIAEHLYGAVGELYYTRFFLELAAELALFAIAYQQLLYGVGVAVFLERVFASVNRKAARSPPDGALDRRHPYGGRHTVRDMNA